MVENGKYRHCGPDYYFAYIEPQDYIPVAIAAMREAMTGKGEAMDLSKWDEFIASL